MHVAIHAFEGITMFHLATPMLVFGEVVRKRLAEGWVITVWSEDSRPVRTAEGLIVDGVSGPEAVETADMLVFPSWPEGGTDPGDEMVRLIREVHRRGATIVGLCLGAFPVAASGVLDGRAAVTHWAATARLRERCPQVEVRDAELYLDHGDVLTSAGTASALDACLHIVGTLLGAAVATELARSLVLAPHREGDQAQYIARPVPAVEGAGALGEAVTWALAHLDRPLSVPDMAARANMSVRNFTRRFRERLGTSPARWLLARRLDEARRLLEVTSWPIDRVARSSGFASVVTFRQNFTAAYSTTPTSYRSRFTGPQRDRCGQ